MQLVDPWPSVLFAFVAVFASYRVTRFLVFDSLVGAHPDSGSKWALKVDGFAYRPDGSDRSWWRGKAGDLAVCPFCTGWHVTWILTCLWFRVWPWELGVEGWMVVWGVAGAAALLMIRDREQG